MKLDFRLQDVDFIPEMVKDFMLDRTNISEFFPHHDSEILEAIEKRDFKVSNRLVLVDTLLEQYKHIGLEENSPVYKNIVSLKSENTFTITTGQQIHAYLGPLYVAHKIQTTIALAAKYKGMFPDFNFVPVFWMATEDHDFEEIKDIRIWSKSYEWDTPAGGPVGRLNPSALALIGKQIVEENRFNDTQRDLMQMCIDAYEKSQSLADASREIIHTLYQNSGLVIIDPDNPIFKSQFKEVLKKEILFQFSFQPIIESSNKIKDLGYKPLLNPRKTNLFLTYNGIRQRVDFIEASEEFELSPSKTKISKEGILSILDNQIVDLSPNVVLRPLYQETILPNLAYIGGAAEVGYWLQLSELFQVAQIPKPLLLLRKTQSYLPSKQYAKWKKLSLPDNLLLNLKQKNKEEELLLYFQSRLTEQEKEIKIKLQHLDDEIMSLVLEYTTDQLKSTKAILKEWHKQWHGISSTIKESSISRLEQEIQTAIKIHEYLFPGGVFSERLQFSVEKYLELSIHEKFDCSEFADLQIVSISLT
jgi:bacillithiol synthase